MSPNDDNYNDVIEAETYGTDTDIESLLSDTTSLSSSAFTYQYENGRRYHAFRAGQYALPNDDKEQDRLDMLHHIWGLVLRGKLTLVPIDESKEIKVLDIGTGTGVFAVDFGDHYPKSDVTGYDLSPIQPRWVPPNVRFEVDDAESDWTRQKNSFDFIHSRNMIVGSIKDLEKYVKNIYDHLKPGGYAEFKEASGDRMYCDDGTYDEKNSPVAKYITLLNKGFQKMGVDLDPLKVVPLLEKAGFVDIKVVTKKAPVGTWPKDKHMKELGRWGLTQYVQATEAYGLAVFTRTLGMSQEDAKKVIEDANKAGGNTRVHGYWKVYVIVARKPEKC